MANAFRRDLLLSDSSDNNRLIADGSLRYQVFKSSTWLTAAATAEIVLTMQSTKMITAGDHLYIEGTDGLHEVTLVNSATQVTVSSPVTAADNAGVILAKKSGTFNYATIYAQPDEETTLSNPLAPADGNATGYVRPGEYGLRLTDSTLTTSHEIRAAVSLGGMPMTVVHPDHDSPTSGIQEAIDSLPPTGGTIMLGPYSYLLRTADATLTIGSNIRLIGSGMYLTTIERDPSLVGTMGASLLTITNGSTDVEIRDLTVDQHGETLTYPNIFALGAQYYCIFGGWCDNLLIQRVRALNSNAGGIRVNGGGGGGQISTNVKIDNCYVENCRGGGITLNAGRETWVTRCTVKKTGQTGIGVTEHGTDPSEYNARKVWILGNYVDRAVDTTPSTGANSTGSLISVGGGGYDVFIIGNLAWDNRLTLLNDGISAGSDSTKVDMTTQQRVVIADNICGLSQGFGIDVGPMATCTGNIIYQPGTHGIAIYTVGVGTDPAVWEPTIVSNNLIIDPANTQGVNTIAGIVATLNGATAGGSLIIENNYLRDDTASLREGIVVKLVDTSSLDRVHVRSNVVQHAAHATRDFSALTVSVSDTATINMINISENDLQDIAVTAGTLKTIEWAGDNLAGVAQVEGLGTNLMHSSDTYQGRTTLIAGVSPALCTGLPANVWNTMNLDFFRYGTTATKVPASGTLGQLISIWDKTNGQFTIESFNEADRLAASGDISTVYYRLVNGSAA